MSGVLITGGTGYIGSWVTRKLVEQGVRVVTYNRSPDTTFLKDMEGKYDCVAGDVLDLPRLAHTIKQYQVERVIHTSTVLKNPLEANPFLGYRVNVDGTLNVFEACRLMDVKRVVYLSSRAVYDVTRGEHASPTYKPIDEDYPKAPRDVYGATKMFMENMGLCYHRIYGLDFIALRFAASYGPGKHARHAFLASNKIIESAMLRQPLKVTQNVDQPDDLMYVKDMANGIVLACFAGNVEHRIFHLGVGEAVTLRNVIEMVNKIFGRVPIEIAPVPGAKSSAHEAVFNIGRARRELGYRPQYGLEKGIKDFIEMMKQLNIKPAVSD